MSETEDPGLDGKLALRIEQKELDIFIKKSKRQLKKPYQLFVREMILAFNEGRLRITPTEAQKNMLSEVYDTK